jgi:hypothetical protein
MDYLLDGRIKINVEPEYKSLYSWCLNEVDDNGTIHGDDQIPWNWSFFFIGSLLQVVRNISFGDVYNDDGEKLKGKFVSQSERIVGQLHSGDCINGRSLEDITIFRMFCSKRKIEFFNLEIYPVENEKDEDCRIEGIPSNSYELDFRDKLDPDYVVVMFYISRKRFEEIANLIEQKNADHVRVRLGGVSGIYSIWSPSISTFTAKVLTRQHLDLIDGDDKIKSTLPTLGHIEEFSLTLITNNKLNLKIDQRPISIEKIFDDDSDNLNFDEEKNSEYKPDIGEEQSFTREMGRHLVLQIDELHKAISKINVAIWILVVILIVQAFN